MRIPGLKVAKTFSRWIKARVFGGALILGYHRIADVEHDEYEVCVTPKHFAEQMEVISKHANPISLGKLVQHLKEDSLPPKSIAITFDDGYADNLYQASPILEKYQIPATIFVCTGYAGKEFWWDELERLIISSQTNLQTLHLQAGENQFVWNQAEVSHGAADLKSRRQFLHAVYRFLLPLDIINQIHLLDLIRNWSGISSNEFSTPRAMNDQELLDFSKNSLIEIGAHTRHHPILPNLSLKRQKEEIYSSKRDLEELLGMQVEGFAYPNGKAMESTKQIVRELGFSYACTSLHDVLRSGTNLYELTRLWQKNVDGDRFKKGLRLWMNI
jgi:peptidoglycan/xylan/chitin deacetylase (PgdA/CDA1 family)